MSNDNWTAIPAHEWESPAIVRACTDRDVGALLRLARKYGNSQTTIAARIPKMAQGSISRIQSGRRTVISLPVVTAIADGLEMPDHARMTLGLAPKDHTHPNTDATSIPSNSLKSTGDGPERPTYAPLGDGTDPEFVPGLAEDGRPADPRDRYELAQGFESQIYDLRDALGANVDESILEALESDVVGFAQQYSVRPVWTLLPGMRSRLSFTTKLLGLSQSVNGRRRLCVIAGHFSGLHAWAAFDLGDEIASEGFYDAALIGARESGDNSLLAWTLGNRSRLATYSGDRRSALNLLLEARESADEASSLTLRSWLNAQIARGYAELGQFKEGGAALAASERLLSRAAGQDFSKEMVFFDRSRFAAFAGHYHLLANSYTLAEEFLSESLELLDSRRPRHIALTKLDLAIVHAAAGRLPDACGIATETLTSLPSDECISAIVTRAGHVGAMLGPVAKGSREYREFEECLDGVR